MLRFVLGLIFVLYITVVKKLQPMRRDGFFLLGWGKDHGDYFEKEIGISCDLDHLPLLGWIANPEQTRRVDSTPMPAMYSFLWLRFWLCV